MLQGIGEDINRVAAGEKIRIIPGDIQIRGVQQAADPLAAGAYAGDFDSVDEGAFMIKLGQDTGFIIADETHADFALLRADF